MKTSESLEDDIRDKVRSLERFCDRITGCHVVVEKPHRHHQQGAHFHVAMDVQVPSETIVIRRDPEERRSHEDIRAALHDAFDAARRRLQDYVRRHEARRQMT